MSQGSEKSVGDALSMKLPAAAFGADMAENPVKTRHDANNTAAIVDDKKAALLVPFMISILLR